MGRDSEEEDPRAERNGENLVWQAKAGKKYEGEEIARMASGDAGGVVLEKDRSKEQMIQSDQNQ